MKKRGNLTTGETKKKKNLSKKREKIGVDLEIKLGPIKKIGTENPEKVKK